MSCDQPTCTQVEDTTTVEMLQREKIYKINSKINFKLNQSCLCMSKAKCRNSQIIKGKALPLTLTGQVRAATQGFNINTRVFSTKSVNLIKSNFFSKIIVEILFFKKLFIYK